PDATLVYVLHHTDGAFVRLESNRDLGSCCPEYAHLFTSGATGRLVGRPERSPQRTHRRNPWYLAGIPAPPLHQFALAVLSLLGDRRVLAHLGDVHADRDPGQPLVPAPPRTGVEHRGLRFGACLDPRGTACRLDDRSLG